MILVRVRRGWDVGHDSCNKFIGGLSFPVLVDADGRGNGPEGSHDLGVDCPGVEERVGHREVEQDADGVDDQSLGLRLLLLVSLLKAKGYELEVDEGVLDEIGVTIQIPAETAEVSSMCLQVDILGDSHLS